MGEFCGCRIRELPVDDGCDGVVLVDQDVGGSEVVAPKLEGPCVILRVRKSVLGCQLSEELSVLVSSGIALYLHLGQPYLATYFFLQSSAESIAWFR